MPVTAATALELCVTDIDVRQSDRTDTARRPFRGWRLATGTARLAGAALPSDQVVRADTTEQGPAVSIHRRRQLAPRDSDGSGVSRQRSPVQVRRRRSDGAPAAPRVITASPVTARSMTSDGRTDVDEEANRRAVGRTPGMFHVNLRPTIAAAPSVGCSTRARGGVDGLWSCVALGTSRCVAPIDRFRTDPVDSRETST